MGVLPCSRQLTVTKQKRETNKGESMATCIGLPGLSGQ